MSGEARDNAQRDAETLTIMQNSVSDSIENWKQDQRKPSKSGGYSEVFNFGSPKAMWRTQIFKFGPFVQGTRQIRTIVNAIPANAGAHLKIEGISLFLSSSLSASIYVDKIGISGTGTGHDPDADYFYSSSSEPLLGGADSFVSSSGRAILAHPGRAGTENLAAYKGYPMGNLQSGSDGTNATGSLHNGGWHTGSANITIQFNAAPATTVGKLYLYVYADKIFKAFD